MLFHARSPDGRDLFTGCILYLGVSGSSPSLAFHKIENNNKKAGDILNIILNDNTIRTTKFNKEKTYELSDINIYIPNDQNHTNAYIILKKTSRYI